MPIVKGKGRWAGTPAPLKKKADMKVPCTGVILAGGRNSRFNGSNKAFITLFGKTVLQRILEAFSGLFEDVLLITKSPMDYLHYDIHIATDVFPLSSSLTGVHAGLFYSHTPYAFFAACDTPFLKPETIQTVIAHIEKGCDAVIPQTKAGLEPLCAVYARACLPAIETQIRQKRFQILAAFQKKRVVRIEEAVFREKDPDLVSFFNINSPQDLETAQQMTTLQSKPPPTPQG